MRSYGQLAKAYRKNSDTARAAEMLLRIANREDWSASDGKEAVWALDISFLLARHGFRKQAEHFARQVDRFRNWHTFGKAKRLTASARDAIVAGDVDLAAEILSAACGIANDAASHGAIAAQYEAIGNPQRAAAAIERAIHGATTSWGGPLWILQSVVEAYLDARQQFSEEGERPGGAGSTCVGPSSPGREHQNIRRRGSRDPRQIERMNGRTESVQGTAI